MTREEKDLLLKDLSGRLPYGVKIFAKYADEYGLDVKERVGILCQIDTDRVLGLHLENEDDYSYLYVSIPEVKPYLFPLNSMTAEQLYELREMFGFEIEFGNGFIDFNGRLSYLEMDALFEWLDKNHFDYRELIPNGLAIDASNLNIY